MKDYRESQKENKDEQQGTILDQDKFLIALSKFRDGSIPVTAEVLEPGITKNKGSVIQQLLEDLQPQGLLFLEEQGIVLVDTLIL